MLYAANGASGAINVFNSAFAPVSLGAGSFATPAAIAAKDSSPSTSRTSVATSM